MAGVRRGVDKGFDKGFGKGPTGGGALISRMPGSREVPVKICIPGLPRPLWFLSVRALRKRDKPPRGRRDARQFILPATPARHEVL